MAADRGYVCFIGEPVLDQYVTVDHWPQVGDKSRFDAVQSRAGGSVANAALACRALGSRCELVGTINEGPAGRALIDELTAEGVGTSRLEPVTGYAEPVCFVISAPEGSIVLYPDRSEERMTLSEPMLRAVAEASVVVSTGEKLARVANRDELRQALARCQRSGGRVLVDLDTGEGLDDVLDLVAEADVVVMNEFGAQRLFPVAGGLPSLEALRSRFPKDSSVVITLGADGVALRGDSSLDIPGVAVVERDATGAGDAFVGALAFSLDRGWPMTRGVDFANRVAAHVVTLLGPRLRDLPTDLAGLA